MKARLALLITLLLPIAALSQDFLDRSELTASVGFMQYMGDLNNQSLFGRPNPAASLGLRVRLNNRMAAALAVAAGHIEGGNPDAIELRNLNFRSPVGEATLRLEFNFVPYGHGATEWHWTPFVFAGVGAFHFNPQTNYTDKHGHEQWVDLQPLGTEGQNLRAYPDRVRYSLNQVCIPFGVGVKFHVARWFSLSAEYGFRATTTDYLDDVSTTYVGSSALSSGQPDGALAARLADRSAEAFAGYVNAPGTKRGDDSLDDWYQLFTITASFNLDALFGWMRPKRCPVR